MGVRSFVLALVAALACLSLACGGAGSPETAGRNSDVSYIPARWADGQARDLDSLLAATGTVFVGTVTGVESQREEAAAASRATFPVTAYRVSVSETIAGDPPAELLIEQVAGETDGADGPQTVILQGDEFLEPGATYLFFSARKDNGAYTSPPFARFGIDSGGKLAPLQAWATGGVAQQLAGEDIRAAIEEIRSHAD